MFKVGDRVKVIADNFDTESLGLVVHTGIIIEPTHDPYYELDWTVELDTYRVTNDDSGIWQFKNSELELIEE